MLEIVEFPGVTFDTDSRDNCCMCTFPAGTPFTQIEAFLSLLRKERVHYSWQIERQLLHFKKMKKKTIRPLFMDEYLTKIQEINAIREQGYKAWNEWKATYGKYLQRPGEFHETSYFSLVPREWVEETQSTAFDFPFRIEVEDRRLRDSLIEVIDLSNLWVN